MQAYNGSLTQAGLSYKNALSIMILMMFTQAGLSHKNALSIMILMMFTQAGLSYTNSSTPMLLPMSLADVQRLASTSQVTKLMMMEIFDMMI